MFCPPPTGHFLQDRGNSQLQPLQLQEVIIEQAGWRCSGCTCKEQQGQCGQGSGKEVLFGERGKRERGCLHNGGTVASVLALQFGSPVKTDEP